MSIAVNNITKTFGKQVALNNVSFSLKKGEIVGFLGPNGAGKSTMMRVLTTFYKADSGNAKVSGFDVLKSAREVQKRIGYLPEHNPLYTEMYVKEYLAFNANIHKVSKSRIDTVIEETGLSPESHKKLGNFPKVIDNGWDWPPPFLHNPEVLILDEPTTGLDPNQLVEVRKLIRKIGKEKTILLSTHIMKEVEAVCDRVIIIDKGTLVADKKLEELRQANEQIIEVEFDYRVEEALLKRLPNISTIKNTGGFVYELTFSTDTDMRPTVFDFAHDNELKTLQLSRKNKNLESLFSELTA